MATEERGPQEPADARSDRFVKWPLYSGLVVVAFCCFVMWWPVAQLIFPMLSFIWAPTFALIVLGLLGATICGGIAAAWHRRWRRLVSMVAFPAVLLTVIPAVPATGYAANWLTFIIHKSSYTAKVDEAVKEGGHHVFFDWGGNPMIGVDRFVVWDEEDQLALSEARQTPKWQKRFSEVLPRYRVIQQFGDRFYLVEE